MNNSLKRVRRVAVFGDEGAGSLSYLQAIKMWRHAFPLDRVFRVKANELKSIFDQGIDILIMPGGRDLFYHKALQGDKCGYIQQFVQEGGLYLGLCAGAYFASAWIDFIPSESFQIQGKRDLGFWKGKAVGPLYNGRDYDWRSELGASLVEIEDLCNQRRRLVYYNAGCCFLSMDLEFCKKDCRLLAKYVHSYDLLMPQQLKNEIACFNKGPFGERAAALRINYGEGKVFLFGYHPEFRATLLNPSHYNSLLVEDLQACDEELCQSFYNYFL